MNRPLEDLLHGDAGLVQFLADQIGAVFEPLLAPGDSALSFPFRRNLVECGGAARKTEH